MTRPAGLHRRAALGGVLALPLATRAEAQGGAYPTKPVRLVVGFAPGGAVDLVARAVADEMTRGLGQTVVVDNRAGASGNIASGDAARAAPDGQTLMMGNGPQLAINPFLFTNLPFDPARDFVPIGQAATVRFVAVVPAGSPAVDLAAFVALTHRTPCSYGSSGIGTVQHLGTEQFKAASGAVMAHVPYRGSGPMVVDVIGGRIDFAIDAESVVAPYVKAGSLRALAVMGPTRVPGLPGVPTIAEAGFGEIPVEGWQGLVAPAATPPAVLARVGAELKRALDSAELRRRFEAASIEVVYRDAPAFADFLAAERERWGALVASLGLKL